MEHMHIWPSPVSPVDSLTLAINTLPGKGSPCGEMGYEKTVLHLLGTPVYGESLIKG